jgi:hypothetical protein
MNAGAVRRLPVENRFTGWEAINQCSCLARSFDGSVTADWPIFDAGFAGLSAARHLLEVRQHDKIAVLESSEIGKGSAERNSRRNHVPAVGEVEEGPFSACCANGLSTVKSTLAGVMSSNLETGQISREIGQYMDHQMPARIPPSPFASLGINSVIRLQELRAGCEG